MQGFIKSWSLRFACYAGLLVTSLALQVSQPEMFALLCTPLPLGGMLQQEQQGLDLPLNRPVVPTATERVK